MWRLAEFLAFSVLLSFFSAADVCAYTSSPGSSPGNGKRVPDIVIDLNYQGLRASLYYGSQFSDDANDRNLIWNDLEKQIRADADSARYARHGASTERYDVWPKLTLDREGDIVDPTYLVRFSLLPAIGKCVGHPIDQELLIVVARIFESLRGMRKKPYWEFSGNLTQGAVTLYQFSLYETGRKPATREKVRDIAAVDLKAINYGRRMILAQTTPKDLLIFVGSSGAYFYYGINRPFESPSDRRNVQLLPLSGARQWTGKVPLDRIRGRPELTNYVNNVLRPIFKTTSASRRVILIDSVCTGRTLVAIRSLLAETKVWNGPLNVISVEWKRQPSEPVPHYTMLRAIRIDTLKELDVLSDGGLGRVVPPYPWFYWDVPPEAVEYPEKAAARRVIKTIRNNGPFPWYSEMNGTAAGNSSTTIGWGDETSGSDNGTSGQNDEMSGQDSETSSSINKTSTSTPRKCNMNDYANGPSVSLWSWYGSTLGNNCTDNLTPTVEGNITVLQNLTLSAAAFAEATSNGAMSIETY